MLRNVALALATSADSLLFDEDERGPDDDLRLQFEATRNLDDDEKEALKALLEASSCATTLAGGRTRRSAQWPGRSMNPVSCAGPYRRKRSIKVPRMNTTATKPIPTASAWGKESPTDLPFTKYPRTANNSAIVAMLRSLRMSDPSRVTR